MTRDHIKGFIFGAALMMMAPAVAMPGTPGQPAPEAQQEANFRLTYEDAEAALSQALADRGAGAKITTSIANRSGDYVFSFNQPISVEIRGLRYEKQTNRFSASLVSLSGKQVISAKPVSGRFDELVEVPVLKRSIRAGEVITANDVEIKDYASGRARSDMILDMASLVGKSPERVISAGRPIRAGEIAQPALVKKNDLVKMVFAQGGMSITASGQALTDGVRGSVIGVRNVSSKKVVQATVQDANTVVIDTGESRVSSLALGGAL